MLRVVWESVFPRLQYYLSTLFVSKKVMSYTYPFELRDTYWKYRVSTPRYCCHFQVVLWRIEGPVFSIGIPLVNKEVVHIM